ncbi:hypothetical protein P3342_007477 [Pyrenophora teres f. teres]|nr:hypothetical protein P3342_007477 [Pyrenophora teres f. teres]
MDQASELLQTNSFLPVKASKPVAQSLSAQLQLLKLSLQNCATLSATGRAAIRAHSSTTMSLIRAKTRSTQTADTTATTPDNVTDRATMAHKAKVKDPAATTPEDPASDAAPLARNTTTIHSAATTRNATSVTSQAAGQLVTLEKSERKHNNVTEPFLAQFEGIDIDNDDDDGDTDEELNAFFNNDQLDTKHQFLTATYGTVDGETMVRNLNNTAALHAITKIDLYAGNDIAKEASHLFTLDHRYGREQFQGIMPDTGAAGVSTAGKQQVIALHRIQPLRIDKLTAGRHRIRFGDNLECVSLGDVNVQIPIGMIKFAVMPTNTPFLLCLDNMDRHSIYFNNVDNMLVHQSKEYPICQITAKAPSRFRFTLRDENLDFNSRVIVDIMYINQKPVLHAVDEATAFQAARFLRDMKASTTWDTLRAMWINMYVGPPDTIATDAGTNFASEEFVNNANAMIIDVYEVPVEAHQSIGKVERYHAAIRRAFEVISADIGTSTTTKDDILQMAVKAINDTAGPEGLIPTLLVFGTYPRLSKTSPPSPSITARATAIRKAMAEVWKIKAKRQVNEALGTRNGPNDIVTQVLELPLQSNVKVWREGLRWTGPHALIALNNDQTAAIVDTYGKQHSDEEPHSDHQRDNDEFVPQEEPLQRRGRGRPKGSKNKPKTHAANLAQREKDDIVLARTLRTTGKITTPGEPFEMSTRTEIDGLITRGVFRFEPYDLAKHGGIRIFKSRIVNEVKGKTTDRPYEKSRLVVQGYADYGKKIVLT